MKQRLHLHLRDESSGRFEATYGDLPYFILGTLKQVEIESFEGYMFTESRVKLVLVVICFRK
jgi:hypothetical protein